MAHDAVTQSRKNRNDYFLTTEVLSDAWVTPIFSFGFAKSIWWLKANSENMRIPKVQKGPQ